MWVVFKFTLNRVMCTLRLQPSIVVDLLFHVSKCSYGPQIFYREPRCMYIICYPFGEVFVSISEMFQHTELNSEFLTIE